MNEFRKQFSRIFATVLFLRSLSSSDSSVKILSRKWQKKGEEVSLQYYKYYCHEQQPKIGIQVTSRDYFFHDWVHGQRTTFPIMEMLRTVFENHRKSLIQHCERTKVDKSSLKMPKMVEFGELSKIQSLKSRSVTKKVNFNWTKIGGKSQN